MSLNTVAGLCVGIIAALFFYLIGAFVAASFDIATWPDEGRFVIALLIGIFAPIVGIAVGGPESLKRILGI